MPKYEDIKATILDVAGNPTSGIIAELAHEWALAIEKLDNDVPTPAIERNQKEVRVTKPAELR